MTTSEKTPTNSVAIIGAGLCGLAAAVRLAQQGISVQVLEKAPHIGGAHVGLSH